jgi:protein SCO1/2
VSLAFALSACAPAPRQFELKGQVLAVDRDRQELTIRHDDIDGFMPAMTMAFKVGDASLLEGRSPGELITATLVVGSPAPHLGAITHTGTAPLPPDAAPRRAMSLVETGQPVRDAALRDTSAASRRLADWRGRVLVVTFVYTRCPLPNFCPLIDRQFAAAAAAVRAADDLRGRVQLLSVTIDPEHDTPRVLAAHAARLGADPHGWAFLTGTPDDIAGFAEQFGVSVIREGEDPAGLVHNLRTAIVDADGRLVKVLGGSDWTPAELLAEIRSARDRG